MKMNSIEKFLMNNPIRAAFQHLVEAPLLEKLGGKTEGLAVLEVGCGRGVGTEIIFKRFGARSVYAVDIDPDMIRRAKQRLAHYSPQQLKLVVGDVTSIDAANQTFDAVFNFAIIHHVPDWQNSIKEIHRVLKTGGRFFFEEVTTHALNKWSYRTFMEHPSENRFSAEEFVSELKKQGLEIIGNVELRHGGDFIFGVAKRIN